MTAAHRSTNVAIRLEREDRGLRATSDHPAIRDGHQLLRARRRSLGQRSQKQLVGVDERPLGLRIHPGSLQRRDLVDFVGQLAINLPRQTPHQHHPSRQHRRRERPRHEQRAPRQDPKPRRNPRNRRPPTPPNNTHGARIDHVAGLSRYPTQVCKRQSAVNASVVLSEDLPCNFKAVTSSASAQARGQTRRPGHQDVPAKAHVRGFGAAMVFSLAIVLLRSDGRSPSGASVRLLSRRELLG